MTWRLSRLLPMFMNFCIDHLHSRDLQISSSRVACGSSVLVLSRTKMMKARNEGACNIVCMKTLFFVFTFLFLLAGIGVMGVGIWIMVYKSDYQSLLDTDIYVIVPGLMIAAGVVVIIVGIVGCLGAAKENRFFLISFLVMVILIFILELTIGVLAFVYSSKIKGELKTAIKEKMNQQYGVNEDVTESIDKLQQENKCCGDTGGDSWNGTSWQQRDGQTNSVPDSCCKTPSEGCGIRTHPSNINNKGCLTLVEEFFQEHFTILAIVGIGVASIQLVGIVITVCILRFVEEY